MRLQRNPELQRRTRAWIAVQLEKPLLRPVAPYLRAGWRDVGQPLAEQSEKPVRFVWHRFTPGDLGLEITTLLSLAAVGTFVFVLLGEPPEAQMRMRMDELAFDIGDRLYSEPLKDLLVWVTALGSSAVCGLLVTITALWAAARRRFLDAIALPVAFLLTWLAVTSPRRHTTARARRDRTC